MKAKSGRPRGYAPYRPHAETRVLIDQVKAILDEYEAYQPLTIRQIFYRLVGQYEYPKKESAYKGLCEKLSRARRARMIPFDAIRDDGVNTYATARYDGVEAFWMEIAEQVRDYRRDRQAGQPQRIELWCEAGGMAPQLAGIAAPFGVPVYSCGGFSSLTANKLIAERVLRRDQPTVVLQAGDYDPSGESIFTAMAEDVATFAEQDRPHSQPVTTIRVALTAQQVSDFGLPTAPPKKSDSRSAKWTKQTCQLEALAPGLLDELVAQAITALADPVAMQAQIEAERADRLALERALPSSARRV